MFICPTSAYPFKGNEILTPTLRGAYNSFRPKGKVKVSEISGTGKNILQPQIYLGIDLRRQQSDPSTVLY